MTEDRFKHGGCKQRSNEMSFDICIYHHPCADGFGAAWVVNQALGDIAFYPAMYGRSPVPDVKGKNVLLVDFSYKAPVLAELAKYARSIVVLDHHKSAMLDLTGTPMPDNVHLIFDMGRSGAMMAWDYFFHDEEPPALIRHIQDRDLWKFELEGTRDIQAAVFSYPYDFAVWDELMRADTGRLQAEGAVLNRKHDKDIAELIKVCGRRLRIGGHDVLAVNLPYTMGSDAMASISEGEPFTAYYYDTDGSRHFGLRSAKDGLDVSKIAASYGGGGHHHAAGFRVPLSEASQFELEQS